ncbi:hypothetical protein DFH27DRAFT_134316 [Peziza echinospora]|nr:hypothetical protein DFH27DRAFT_134316 [Peziza echinospora]
MSSKAGTDFLQLPILDTFEPLTKGTNLPSVPFEPSPAPSCNTSVKDHEIEPTTSLTTSTDATTPPRSPTSPASTRPGSMRRFLSRVSLNSTYDKDGIAPPLSPTGSIMSVGRNPPKKSWWRWKDKNTQSIDATLEQEPTPANNAVPARPTTPPPKLPDLAPPPTTFDEDLFKDFK